MDKGIEYKSDLLEQDLIPFKTNELIGNRVLVLAPHPDDETLGCGGTLVKHVKNNDPVRVIFLTDGGKGDFRKAHEATEYIELREKEARNACKILGVTDLIFLRLGDRTLGSDSSHYDRVKEEVASYNPSLIYVTSPQELNPDHRAAAFLAWQLIQELRLDLSLAFYEVSTPFQPNTLVDISEEVVVKKQAAACYQSQMSPIDYSELAIAVNRFRSLSIAKISNYAEAFIVMNSRQIIGRKLFDYFTLKSMISKEESEERPLVSIIVRTKDRPHLLREALASLESQEFKDFEVIVVNDGGSDIQEVADCYNQSLHLRLINHDQNEGRSAAANTGLIAAKGRYLGLLDDDDVLYPNHLEVLVKELESGQEELVYSDCVRGHYEINEAGESQVIPGTRKKFKGLDFDKERLYQGNYIPMMAALFSRALWEKAGPFDTSLDLFEDWDLWIRMSMYTSFKRIDTITAEYRVFGDRPYDYLSGQIRIYEKYWHLCTPKKLMEWLHKTQVRNDLLQDRIDKLEGDLPE